MKKIYPTSSVSGATKTALAHVKKASLLLVFSALSTATAFSQEMATHLVISEVSGGGGNTSAPYKSDYIELYNPTNAPISINNWSVQYSPSDGESWSVTNLTGSVKAKGYFLIKLFTGNGVQDLPHFDLEGTTSMASLRGKVVLVNNTTAVQGPNPSGDHIIDKVGWGRDGAAATGFEGSPAPTSSTTSTLERKALDVATAETMGPGGEHETQGNGYDTDDNNNDFVITPTPSPQFSGSAIESPTVTGLPGVLAGAGIPKALVISSVFPNPVQTESTVRFGLPKSSGVKVLVYSAAGVLVKEGTLGTFAAGFHEATWYNAAESALAPGNYLLRLVSGNGTVTERVVVTR